MAKWRHMKFGLGLGGLGLVVGCLGWWLGVWVGGWVLGLVVGCLGWWSGVTLLLRGRPASDGEVTCGPGPGPGPPWPLDQWGGSLAKG